MRGNATRTVERLRNAAGGEDVVFLDQDGVVEPETVVVATAAGDGVFLGETQAGKGLAGIDDAAARAGDGVGEAAGLAGHAGEQLEKVEGRAFAGEQGACRPFDGAQHLSRLDRHAVLRVPADVNAWIERRKGAGEPGGAAEDGFLARNDRGAGALRGGNELGGQVAGADVFGQGAGDVAFDFVVESVVGGDVERAHGSVRRGLIGVRF